ncbi:hypothetical protein WJX73_003389 [Symbiochloris irregularis]|uniref:DNA polymerase epsilon catalytic subunit n=1 Tax=Symbiochloris irregularis TaxID=706552 RepID=A0AAW1NWQ6_9CHLO
MAGDARGRGGGGRQAAFRGRGGHGGRVVLNRGMGAGRGRGRGSSGNYIRGQDSYKGGGEHSSLSESARAKLDDHVAEAGLGFPLFKSGPERLGWLFNMNATNVEDKESGHLLSAVNCFFMCQDGSMFKAQVEFAPYFYLQAKEGMHLEVDGYLRRKYGPLLKEVNVVQREDLDLKNHLSGLKRTLLQVKFWNVQQLMDVKRELTPVIRRNASKGSTADAYAVFDADKGGSAVRLQDALDAIVDMREHDVAYHMRFAIDTGVRCGHWFTVSAHAGKVQLSRREDLLQRGEPRICAFDIETTKLPLQFPNAEFDQVFMISYMIDGQGFLIVNRQVVSEDINDFEYTPKPEFDGPFTVFNEANETATLQRWFDHMREVKPSIYVTYNGDFFDWPFIETRAEKCGLSMLQQTGFQCGAKTNECLSRCAVHMDCMHWVSRDSYLPMGSRGLKAVTKAKLGYDPVEVDPEDMVRFAAERPQTMAAYSVSDAVATYYLYTTYIHPFIFSLSTIIPMPPDEVLRKGSGTLCELLLMVQAFQANVVAPNKHVSVAEGMFRGHPLESETYIGGKVEALESGVFRSDLPTRFKLRPAAYQGLIDNLDRDLRYAIEVECKASADDVANYDEVRDEIVAALEGLRDVPNREECPLIYHLDVAAMYPNIILTNRLQPSAVVTDEDCAACDFNRPGKTCLRPMQWVWRGETFAASAQEYFALKNQLSAETFPASEAGGPVRFYTQLPHEERAKLLKDRLKKYCQRVYKRVLDKPIAEERTAGVCMRENDFYVGTVRAFRDRRYEYKALNKQWKGKLEGAKAGGNPIKIAEASDMVVLYDSLQLAHKCILNSFYGYVMRRGARWFSMEMAGVVTNTGAAIIQRACRLVEQLGLPLELDTDGIWCALPASFPENFQLKMTKGKDLRISYPCVMLNVMVAEHNTNDQYQDLVDPLTRTYATSSQMSIEFEVDGPYKAMVLPASKEEGKLIKKRYAVFNEDGSLAELKGFELKRRGELKLIKVFQSEVFEQFLAGESLKECYDAVGAVANRWLDLLDTQGVDVTDEELLDYISESSMMSKAMDEYEGRKSCAITTAKRLGMFLGDDRIKDKGLNCHYVIARNPQGKPTSERAVPVAIFSAQPAVARSYLRKWCGELASGRGADEVPDVRAILDWAYYKERLGSAIQKIITIPAAMQHIANPVPRVAHPDWLHKQVSRKDDKFQQQRIGDFFARKTPGAEAPAPLPDEAPPAGADAAVTIDVDIDIEDAGQGNKRKRAGAGMQAGSAARRRAGDKENAVQPNIGEGRGGAEGNAVAAAGPPPNRKEDPSGWIAWQKGRWRKAVAQRKRRRLEAAAAASAGRSRREAAGPDPGGTRGVGAMLRRQGAAAVQTHWQILQLAPTAQPGVFKAWVMAGTQVYATPLRVPRSFYINSGLPPAHPLAQGLGFRVSRTLPHGHQPINVYQITLEEGELQTQSSQLTATSRLATADIKGVYEDRLPLDTHACLSLGCVSVVAEGSRGRNLAEGFDMAELQAKTTTECDYLAGEGPEGMGPLRHIALYHSHDPARTKGVFVLHLVPEHRAVIVLVTGSSAAAKEVQATLTDAGALLQRHLRSIRERHRGPMVMVVEAPEGSHRLSRTLPFLSDFPCADIPPCLQDSTSYPTLQWQAKAAKVGIARAFGAAYWLQERVALARYAHLPLGNIGPDWELAAADALYARCLRDAKHLLWSADPSLPGLALPGCESGTILEESLEEDECPTMEACFPGAYRCVCVRVRLLNLTVNAIVKSDALAELEGGVAAMDASGSAAAFRVLKQLVSNWLTDATQYSNLYADALLQNVWRWLCAKPPQASLSDPGLKAAVQQLQRKTLAQLVAEMRRLGATVVAADTTSVILATGKRNLTAAIGYTDYLLEALRRRDVFQWIRLAPQVFWHTLLLRDRFNFLGLKAPVAEMLIMRMTQAPGSLTQAPGAEEEDMMNAAAESERKALDHPEPDMLWNIKEYLPAATQDAFLAVVTEFVWLPWQHAMQNLVEGASQGGSQAAKDARSSEEAQTEWLKQNLGPLFARRLLGLTGKISINITPQTHKPDQQFPLLSGSHLTAEELGTPALAFARSVCEVLGLDASVADEVGVLKRNLMRLTHTREFSPQATFVDPCKTLLLRDVICTSCNSSRDLDLCRDPHLQARQWACDCCGAPYDLGLMEGRLVSVLQARAKSYQLQDLKCSKCRRVAGPNLGSVCPHCAGALQTNIPLQDFKKNLSVFRNIALYHAFDLLGEAAEWLLQLPSAAL